jgi:hypothetical protein
MKSNCSVCWRLQNRWIFLWYTRAWVRFKVPYSEPVYIGLQVIRRKKEEISSGNKKYIESSVTPEEKTVTTAFKSLKDDLDEQDENDVGKQNAPPSTTNLSPFERHKNAFILRHLVGSLLARNHHHFHILLTASLGARYSSTLKLEAPASSETLSNIF